MGEIAGVHQPVREAFQTMPWPSKSEWWYLSRTLYTISKPHDGEGRRPTVLSGVAWTSPLADH